MTGEVTTIASARLGWQVLAKVPWLSRRLLRRAFPITRCKSLFTVEAPGNQARFELLEERPSPALTSVEVTLHNHLPFRVEFEGYRLSVSIDSYGLLDAVENSICMVPATGLSSVRLPDIALSDQQARWVRARSGDSVRIALVLYWRCRSSFHDWEDQHSYDRLVYVNKNRTGGAP